MAPRLILVLVDKWERSPGEPKETLALQNSLDWKSQGIMGSDEDRKVGPLLKICFSPYKHVLGEGGCIGKLMAEG